jgi:kinesin family member 6/9
MLSLTAPAGADTAAVLSSRLTLVDLAGSERLSKTGSEGALPIREAGAINRSLALLEQVVVAASERGREHVPYRSCKLTHVLRDAIGGNCATTLVANVWAHPGQLEESVSTAR